MKKVIYLLIAVIGLSLFSCKPYQESLYVDIKPNETAYLIPLEKGSKNGQAKMNSESYLEDQKVAAKRVNIPTRWQQTGRFGNTGKWIKTVTVIVVDRAPVTREWTDGDNGTSTKKEHITVESKNSIGFGIPITCTASIPEDRTSRFLYEYSGKSLDYIMDYEIRAYIQDKLTAGFGSRDLKVCQEERQTIYDDMKVATIKHFAEKGIKINTIGAAGDWTYLNKEIQDAINLEYVAQKKLDASQKEVDAANKFLEAQRAIEAQKKLDVDILIKQSQANLNNALADAARAGKLPMPTNLTIIGDDKGVFDIYASKKMNK